MNNILTLCLSGIMVAMASTTCSTDSPQEDYMGNQTGHPTIENQHEAEDPYFRVTIPKIEYFNTSLEDSSLPDLPVETDGIYYFINSIEEAETILPQSIQDACLNEMDFDTTYVLWAFHTNEAISHYQINSLGRSEKTKNKYILHTSFFTKGADYRTKYPYRAYMLVKLPVILPQGSILNFNTFWRTL